MKTLKLNYLLAIALLSIALVVGIFVVGCKKDNSSNNNPLANNDVAIAQDAESQDAVADNIDQSIDNKMTDIEENGFNSSKQKSAMTSGDSWTCLQAGDNKTDTATFPKKITITFGDTTINGENIKYTGSIVVTDSLSQPKHPWRNYLIRKIKYNLVIVSDSSSIIVTGTRTVNRTSIKYTPPLTTPNITSFRVDAVDAITANLTFQITCGTYTGTFTRVVDRTREAIAHFEKGTIYWRQASLKDTLIYNGSVTGVNLQDSVYSRIITVPVTFTRCPLLFPVISSGTITATNGTKIATITYTSDVCKTKVTITRGDKVKVFELKINRKYHKWW
jgi:hypothetical protein